MVESRMPPFEFADWEFAMDWVLDHDKTVRFVYWLINCYREEFGRKLTDDLVGDLENNRVWQYTTIENAIYNISDVFMERLSSNVFEMWNEVVFNNPNQAVQYHTNWIKKCFNWLNEAEINFPVDQRLKDEALKRLNEFVETAKQVWAEIPKRFSEQVV